ncbi:MAG: ATP-dependent zinc metalloprotease FtsH [Lachnospiraceae bacterium]|nr:ATP-dependent zinc metalloprotease FtsH [Lachnospiraceae bacterium]
MEENNNNSNGNPNSNNNGSRPGGSPRNVLMVMLVSAVLLLIFKNVYDSYTGGTEKEIPYSQFIEMLENKEVESVEITGTKINIKPKEQTNPVSEVTYVAVRVTDYELVKRLEQADVEFTGISTEGSMFTEILYYAISLLLFWGLLFVLFRTMTRGGGGIMGVGKSTAKRYMEKKTGVTFEDLAGQDESKESLTEMVDFLHNPGRYLEIGAKLPKGALLVGPPGTGKTLLAKAVAGEADVPFFSLSGSDFVEMYVGVGASRVRDLFKQANSMAPCIIFIDEIDAIGRSRDSRHGGDSEREQTLNQLLSEMDGFDTSKGIVILAATNRPEVLDKALLRPGRFDRRVVVEKPDLKGRVETLKVHSKNVKMDETVDLKELALATSGAVGADLANIINEAALGAVKAGKELVSQSDLFEAVEVVFAGKQKKDRILSKREKEIVAYHETGHALCTALQKHTEPVQKITIIPRTHGALGYVWQVPEEEKHLTTREELEADLVTYCAGRAAEAIKFGSITDGAYGDIKDATNKARRMITMLGMSDEFGMVALENMEDQYLSGNTYMNCSEQTQTKVDDAVRRLMKDSYDKAYKLLKEHEDLLDALAKYLYEKETITGKEFMEIYARITGETLKSADEEKFGEEETADGTTEHKEVSSEKAQTEEELGAAEVGASANDEAPDTTGQTVADEAEAADAAETSHGE